jgi:hypothetical protein
LLSDGGTLDPIFIGLSLLEELSTTPTEPPCANGDLPLKELSDFLLCFLSLPPSYSSPPHHPHLNPPLGSCGGLGGNVGFSLNFSETNLIGVAHHVEENPYKPPKREREMISANYYYYYYYYYYYCCRLRINCCQIFSEILMKSYP